ncbi:unnamed protein product [Heterobilharzia americana]|nr:unnamed protein product [Heterobilharzia americana]
MSTLDTIKLSEPISLRRFSSRSSLPFTAGEPLTVLPDGADAIRVQWKPSETLLSKSPQRGISDYRLEMRRPYDLEWKSIGMPKSLDLIDGIAPITSPVEYRLDNLKPGEHIELRIATRPSRSGPPIPVTDTLSYQFIPPYDIPSKPRGPLMADILPMYSPVYSRRPSSVLERVESPLSSSIQDSKSIELKWHPPLDTGGLPITEYVIERRGGPIKSFINEWIPVLSVSGETTKAMIPFPSALTNVSPYSFRVRAVNRMGASSPLETTRPLNFEALLLDQTSRPSSRTSYRPLPPAAPVGPLRSELLPFDSRVHLEWQHSVNGPYKLDESRSMPSTYVIEASEACRPGGPWIEVGRVPGTVTSADVRILPTSSKSESYQFPSTLLYRVRGENDFGSSAPLVTRIEPSSRFAYGSQPELEYPKFTPGNLQARLLPTSSEYQLPQIELHWPSVAPEYRRRSTASSDDLLSHRIIPDTSYLLQVRKAEDIGWQTIASLPYGQEKFIYRPKMEELNRPRSSLGSAYKLEDKPLFEGYQFRVAPRSHFGVGKFLESDVVSWTASHLRPEDFRTIRSPGPVTMEIKAPFVPQPMISPPERFHLVDVSMGAPSGRLQDRSGSVTLRWHPPTGMPSTLRSNADFVIESWRPDKQEWWPVARRSAAVSAESIPGTYELQVNGLPLGQTYHFRVLTETRDARSEPTVLPQPVFIPKLDTETKAIPAPPSHLRVSSLTGTSKSALITWLPPGTVTFSERRNNLALWSPPMGYVLEYCVLPSKESEPTKWKRLAELNAWETSYQTNDLEPGSRYLFRIMSRGKTTDSRSFTPSRFGRIGRSTVDSGVFSEATHSEIFEVPRQSLTMPRLTGDLIVQPVSTSSLTPSVSLNWNPTSEPLTGYILDLYDLNEPTGWRTVTRMSTNEIIHPFRGVTVTGLIPGHSYRFRVMPNTYTLHGTKSLEYDKIDYDSLIIPPPKGPLHIESVSDGVYRLSWRPVHLRSTTAKTDNTIHLNKLDDQIEYIIEEQTPARRFWLEVGRTRLTNYVLPVGDSTVRFRIRATLADVSSIIEKRGNYSLSYDGLLSDWIRSADESVEFGHISRIHEDSRRRLSSDTAFDIGRIVPDRLHVLHIGPTSALLGWDSLITGETKTYPGYLILERCVINEFKPNIWEPIAKVHASETSYEVHGLSSGTTYNFRLVGFEESTKTRSTKYCQLSTPFKTLGKRDSLDENLKIQWIDKPRLLSASGKVEGGQEGIMLTWKAPEMPNRLDEKLLYRIEVVSELKSTQYFINHVKLDNLFSKSDQLPSYEGVGIRSTARRRHIRSVDLDQQQWQFRVFAELDDKQSLPAITQTPITLIPPTKRSSLRFLNLKDDRIIYAVHGKKLVLSVEIEGEPKPEVTWYLNHIQIDDRILPGCRVAQVGVGVYELTIEQVQQQHTGFLECRAWNVYESISETWKLIVSAVPRFGRLGWAAQPREYELRHGDSWYLRIPLEGLDYIQDQEWITKVWFERISHITTGLSVEPLENRVRLNLSYGCPDTGLYRLWIQNQAGRDYIDIRLRIADKPHIRLQKPRSQLKFTGYRVEYCRDEPGEDWHLLGTTSADQTHFTARSQLEKDLNYRFRVRLENWHGLGPASEASDATQLPVHHFTEVLNLDDLEFRHYTDGSFDSRYEIMEELARTKYSGLYRLAERSTGRSWLATIVDTTPSALSRRPASALGKRDISYPELPPRPVSVLDNERSVRRRASYDISRYTNRHDITDWEQEKAERELKLFSRIQQESFAHLHEAYTEAKRTICVMEDVTAGDTLWHQLDRRITVTEHKAADILRQLLDLTAQIHKSGRVHLGLQPENIFLLTRQTQAPISDKPVRLSFRSMVYIPPELTSSMPISKSARIGQSADMWSLGLLLYQMTTGDTEGLPEPEKLEKMHYSSKMVDFTKRLLHPDPKQRMTVHQALQHPWITSTAGKKSDIVEESESKFKSLSLPRPPSSGSTVESRQYYYNDYQTSSSKESEEIVVHARITPRGQAPEILTPMGSVTAAEGSTTVLRCAVYLPKIRKSSHPTDQMSDLQIRWSLNGRELNVGHILPSLKTPPTQHYTCTYDTETGDIKLHISDVTVYDAGTYEVTVTGRYGHVSDSANLKVYGK